MPSTPTSSPEFLTEDEAAKLLRVTRVALYKWRQTAGLPYARAGRRILYSRAELLEWIRAHTIVGDGAQKRSKTARRTAEPHRRSHARRRSAS